MAKNDGRTLTIEQKDALAYEIALGYFEADELRRKFKLQPHAFMNYITSEEIKDLVMLKKREIDESDFALKVHARRAARTALDEYIKIVKDGEAPVKSRIEAGRQIREIAEGVDRAVGASEEGGMVIVKTNLDLDGAKGVYVVTAEEVSEQMAENLQLAKESAGDAELDALLGV